MSNIFGMPIVDVHTNKELIAEIESLTTKVKELEAVAFRSQNAAIDLANQLSAEQSKVKVLTDAINHVVTNGLGNHSIVALMQAIATVKEGK